MSNETPTIHAPEAADTERVPPGYKNTEIGVIPEDWEVKRLGECLAESPEYGINAPAVDYDVGLPTYIRITDITDGGRFSPEKLVSVNNAGSEKYFLERGDLVFARTGASVGKSYLYDENDGALVFAGFLIRVRPDKSKLLPGYLTNYVTTSHYWSWVNVMSTRSGQPGVNGKEYAQLPVPIPPLPEQRAIAAALSDVDALIAALDRLIAKKRAVKTAAMQRLLTGKQRLPGFVGEWEVKRLGDVCQIISGGTPSTSVPEFWAGGIPWCTPTDITENNDKYLSGTNRTISESGLKHSSAALLPRGALLLCTRATIGEIKIAAVPVCTNQEFKSLVCGTDVSNEFLFYKLVTLKDKLRELGVGSTFLEVSRKDIASLAIPLPTLEEQRAIATVLSDMDAEITALEARREKTREVKRAMMGELLTGKTRLV